MKVLASLCLMAFAVSCAPGEKKLSASSEPINNKERILYEQGLIRCHKTGGTRIVKIQGELRCY